MTLTADAGAARTTAPREATYSPGHPLDLMRTLGVLRRGAGDPTITVDGHVVWIGLRTDAGLATLALRAAHGEVHASAWGPGAAEALDAVPRLCGADDDSSGFDASQHPLVEAAAQRHPGMRLTRTDRVFEALAGSIIEQKVTGMQAFGAWRQLVSRFGERAPGPTPRAMFVPPSAQGWRRIPSWAWQRAAVQPQQSRALVRAAQRGDRIEQAVHRAEDGAARERVLTSLPGVGPWTSAETRQRALGDPDAVSVGDYHLAHEIGFALTGSRTDDDGMLELLSPWTGQRHRTVRLILASGVAEPRRGPRLAPEDHRRR
ncbi:DNA-3-methyladenine glycosylase 2 family protein [Microbacterium sp. KUDC0406]|uniref:DNA-3-methyladenine glycosylase family protein n=1 Tax=Microbacterium sp. KUDC0406 TaxID=2909588 RepID=UPI001F4270D9|nr:DNA-3-methyladenine glycosylase 2 family protein [Microbacterium sp. KUDC0406]UJP09029.1 DNA-3-methyladenine glycosylase 2 family protein [Microbacterium sp. KUDC0406]